MTGAAAAVMNDAATGGGGGSGLTVAIGPGQSATSTGGGHTFSGNTVVVTGGTPSYFYAWSDTNDGFGTWGLTNPTSATATPHVAGVFPANSSNASVVCTVTDSSGTPLVQTSNVANYSYFHYSNE